MESEAVFPLLGIQLFMAWTRKPGSVSRSLPACGHTHKATVGELPDLYQFLP
jgi:hypothetical protein